MVTIDPNFGMDELFGPSKKGRTVSQGETAVFNFGDEDEIGEGYRTTPQQKINMIEAKSKEIQKLIDNQQITKADIENFFQLEKIIDSLKASLFEVLDDLTDKQNEIYDNADTIISQFKTKNANAIQQYQIDIKKEAFAEDIEDLQGDIENTFQTYEVAESALAVRDKIISELRINNMTDEQKNIMNLAEKIVEAGTSVGEYLAENQITLSPKDRKALEQVCEEMHRSDPDDRKTFSQKEKIYIVKNAYDDFALTKRQDIIASQLVDVAVREHLYHREQPKDSFYTQRTVHRGKGIQFGVDRSATYIMADKVVEQNAEPGRVKSSRKRKSDSSGEFGFLPSQERVDGHWDGVKKAIDESRRSPFAPHNIIYKGK